MKSNPIEGQRIILIDPVLGDAQSIYDLWHNPEYDEFMHDPVSSVEEVISICQALDTNSDYLKVVKVKGSDEIIGTCCFGEASQGNAWGFGYSIRKDFWGKGYATEIVKTIIEYGKEKGIGVFLTDCAELNVASARVLEKSGMTLSHKSSFFQPNRQIEYISLVYKLEI